jgi:hypothetical protein
VSARTTTAVNPTWIASRVASTAPVTEAHGGARTNAVSGWRHPGAAASRVRPETPLPIQAKTGNENSTTATARPVFDEPGWFAAGADLGLRDKASRVLLHRAVRRGLLGAAAVVEDRVLCSTAAPISSSRVRIVVVQAASQRLSSGRGRFRPCSGPRGTASAGAVAPRRLELELHLPSIVELHAFVRKRRPGDVEARLFQPPARVRLDPHRRLALLLALLPVVQALDEGSDAVPRCAPAALAGSASLQS